MSNYLILMNPSDRNVNNLYIDIGIQKEIISVLRAESFFDGGGVINKESGMEVRITTKGIKETLGNGNRFQTLPKKLKIYKISVIRSLPELIETGYVIADNVENSHSKEGCKYGIGSEFRQCFYDT